MRNYSFIVRGSRSGQTLYIVDDMEIFQKNMEKKNRIGR